MGSEMCIRDRLTTACAGVPIKRTPNPPRSMAELKPAGDLEARREQFEQHAFSLASKTTTVVMSGRLSSSTRRYSDHSLLAQDGSYYALRDYLPELQRAGIAEEVENPTKHYQAVQQASRWFRYAGAALLAGPLTAYILPDTDCGRRPSISDDARAAYDSCNSSNMMRPIYGLLVGALAGGGLAVYGVNQTAAAARPLGKARAMAKKERKRWARAYNKKLLEKLGLQEAPSVTTSP